MTGLLDDVGEFIGGNDTVKDQYGLTQADRRMPIWGGLLRAGMMAYAGGGNLMPEDRARYYAQAGGALADIPGQMWDQRNQSSIAQSRLQDTTNKKAELMQSERWRQYAGSPEVTRALEQLSPAQRIAAQGAILKGDFATYEKLVDPAKIALTTKPQMKDGNVIYPNGDIYNPLYGWVVKDGKPMDLGGGAGATPARAGGPPAAAPAPGGDIDQEIAQWSKMKASDAAPYGMPASPFEGRDYSVLHRLPPAAARKVAAIGDYDEGVAVNSRLAQDALTMDLVRQYTRGTWNQGEYAFRNQQRKEYAPTGPTGKSMLAMDTAYQHIGHLWELGKAMQSNDTPLVNKILQTINTQAGKDANAGFNVAKIAVADEVAKAFRGQGALNKAEQEEWQHQFDAAKSPEQLQSVIENTMKLLEGKEKAVKSAWLGDMKTPMRDFLSADSRAVAKHIRENPLGNSGGGRSPNTAAGGAAPAAGMVKGSDGVWRFQ